MGYIRCSGGGSGGGINDVLIYGCFYDNLTYGGSDKIDISDINEITIFNCSRQDSPTARNVDIYLDGVLVYNDFPLNNMVNVDVSNNDELELRPYQSTATSSYEVILKNCKRIYGEYIIYAASSSGVTAENFNCKIFDVTKFKKVTIENTGASTAPTYRTLNVKLDNSSTVSYTVTQGQTVETDITNNNVLKIYPNSQNSTASFNITLE